MRILGIKEPCYEIRYGSGPWTRDGGVYYEELRAEAAADLLMTERISKPMKNRVWVRIYKDGVLFRNWKRLEPEIWKEFSVD